MIWIIKSSFIDLYWVLFSYFWFWFLGWVGWLALFYFHNAEKLNTCRNN